MACDPKTMILMSKYANAEATPLESAQASAHLAGCPDCRQVVKEWQGQRQILEWAFTVEVSEESGLEEIKHLAEEGKPMVSTIKSRFPRMRFRFTPSWNPAKIVAAAAVLVLAFLVYHFAAPPVMKVGGPSITNTHPVALRIGNDIRLKLGPDTVARRIDAGTIRLERGWIAASVKHGSDFRIVTNRMEVRDRGTVFRVGSGPRMDYVTVEQGEVTVVKGSDRCEVRANQVLVAEDTARPIVASLAKPKSGRSTKLGVQPIKESDFVPSDAGSIQWDDKYRKLARKFPEVRWSGGSGWGTTGQGDSESWYYHIFSDALEADFASHFGDIAQVMAGGRIEGADWEIPLGIIRIHDSASIPGLSGDTFFVQLVTKDGSLAWRLTGLDGGQGYVPFTAGTYDNHSGHSSYSTGQVMDSSETPSDDWKHSKLTIQFSAWPGKLKPIFSVTTGTAPMSESRKVEYAMLDEIAFRIGRSAKELRGSQYSLLYLDRRLHHKILIDWFDTGKGLSDLNDLIKQGRGGSVTLGAISTDMPLTEPNLKAGIYLVTLTTPNATETPHFELVPTEGGIAGKPVALGSPKARDLSSSAGWSIALSERYTKNQNVQIRRETGPADLDGFPFVLKVLGRPDGTIGLDKAWAEGRIHVKKP